MGRKIPGRKHRGVRDLEKQRQDRLDKLKEKVNAPPIDKNDQEIPKSLTRIKELCDKVKSGEIGSKKKPKLIKSPQPYRKKSELVVFKPSKAGLENNAGPVYIQEPGETDNNFKQRVNKVVKEVIQENAYEEKYKVNIKRNQETGKVEKITKRDKDPLEKYATQLRKEQKLKGKKMKKVLQEKEVNKLSKTQKRLRKQKLKKELKDKDIVEDLVEVQHEHVGFGEVAHAPPTLVRPRKVENTMCAPRPGTKDLLLKKVLKSNQGTKQLQRPKIKGNKSSVKVNNKMEPKVINRQGKRKNLPVALRRQLDTQQSEIIKAYKELKKQKYKN